MTEFAPPGKNPRMTKAQVRKYVRNMKQAQKIAQAKLDAAKQNNDQSDQKDLDTLEDMLEEL